MVWNNSKKENIAANGQSCCHVYVYSLKTGGEKGEAHYCFLWKGILEKEKPFFC